MLDYVTKTYREIQELRRQVALLRKLLLRLGKVQSVDVIACTVVVEFAGEDVTGARAKSLPMPWLQRSTEHRPPAVGDHALVIDPSLGNGAGLAITGWPSTAKPAPDGAAQKHVLYSGTDPCKVISPDVQLGVAPSDYAALAAKVDQELARIWDVLTNASILPAPAAGVDAGEPGLVTLKSVATAQALLVVSVAATQVKVQ